MWCVKRHIETNEKKCPICGQTTDIDIPKVVFRKTFATLEEAIKARKEAEEQYVRPLVEKWKAEDETRLKDRESGSRR